MENEFILSCIAKAQKQVLKDVRHSILIGIGSFILFAAIGLLPNNRHLLTAFLFTAFFLFFILLIKALVDKKRPFYLVDVNEYTLIAAPYSRIKGTFDYYFSITSSKATYSCSASKSCKQLQEHLNVTKVKVVAPFYQALQGKQKLVVLLSSTKTLLGCFDASGNFLQNS